MEVLLQQRRVPDTFRNIRIHPQIGHFGVEAESTGQESGHLGPGHVLIGTVTRPGKVTTHRQFPFDDVANVLLVDVFHDVHEPTPVFGSFLRQRSQTHYSHQSHRQRTQQQVSTHGTEVHPCLHLPEAKYRAKVLRSDPSLAGQGVWWEAIGVLTWGFVL